MTTGFVPNVLLASYYDREVVAGPLQRLGEFARVTDANRGRNLTRSELLAAVPGMHVTVAADERYTAEVLDAADSLLLIARDGTGYDGVDVDAASGRGILVARAPVVHDATANMVIGLMLALVRKIVAGNEGVRAGLWTERRRWLCPDVTGMTLGVVGYGQVGRAVSARAQSLGMQVVAADTADVGADAQAAGVEFVTLGTLLASADIVSVHVRHSAATAGMFGAARFAAMKAGAYFINTARGGLVDEAALLVALNGGHLAGAALDVLAIEPPAPDNPLFRCENVICMPHVGGDTSTTMVRAIAINVSQIADCCGGRQPPNLLNPQVWPDARLHRYL